MPNQNEIPRRPRRGRPFGKNRVPLSAEVRRARNAQYERERRNEYAETMLDLAVAARCDSGISHPDLLATVINQIQRAAQRSPSEDIKELQRINENLESQIAYLTERLENESETCDLPAPKKYELSEASELRTDDTAQTSNCSDRAARMNKQINKLKLGNNRKIPRLSTTPYYNQPHTSMETTVSRSEVESSQSSNERLESDTPEPQSSYTESWPEISSYSALTNSQSQTSFHTRTELHEGFACDQMNQLEPQTMQRTTVYSPPPDLVPEVKTTSQSDIHFTFDQSNIPEIQHTPDSESKTDIFTDNDKCLLTERMNCNSDLFQSETYDSSVPARQWCNDEFLTL